MTEDQVGGCLQRAWAAWRSAGVEDYVVDIVRSGYVVPLAVPPPLAEEPVFFPSYAKQSEKALALEEEIRALVKKGAVEPAPMPSPGYYSLMFVVRKASGGWRPIIDLSTLNGYVTKTPFKMLWSIIGLQPPVAFLTTNIRL